MHSGGTRVCTVSQVRFMYDACALSTITGEKKIMQEINVLNNVSMEVLAHSEQHQAKLRDELSKRLSRWTGSKAEIEEFLAWEEASAANPLTEFWVHMEDYYCNWRAAHLSFAENNAMALFDDEHHVCLLYVKMEDVEEVDRARGGPQVPAQRHLQLG